MSEEVRLLLSATAQRDIVADALETSGLDPEAASLADVELTDEGRIRLVLAEDTDAGVGVTDPPQAE